MSVETVINPFRKDISLLYTRETTLEKGLMNAEIVGNPLSKEIGLLYTRKSILEERPYECKDYGKSFKSGLISH
jgi:hypothetical protein